MHGEDFQDRVAAIVVSEEEDVRDVLAKIALGEADAGIVYISDAAFAGDDESLGCAFIAYPLSDKDQAILKRYGFRPVE